MSRNVTHVLRLYNDVEFFDEPKAMGMKRPKIFQRAIFVEFVEFIKRLLKDKANCICKLRISQLEKIQHAYITLKRVKLLHEKFGV